MSFSPCFLIPVYNHHLVIGRTVERLAQHGLPIFIVDDGSDKATQQALADIAAREPLVRLHRLPVNRGKGAAVMRGFREACSAGMSHALQIDADGQHDLNDVDKFLAASKQDSKAVICGQPIYDDSIPAGRKYGRYLTHVWVWIETLSFDIKDAMCGFRLYPLQETCKLISETDLPSRMDFDIAVVVKLAWRGLRFINIPTRVIYPEDGVSHFRLWRDNAQISRTHAQLFFGMLFRLPKILFHRLSRQHA